MEKPILIGITGGTGSGKSTIADALYSNFSKDRITMIQQDMYYKDQSHLSMEERVKTNYDHPMAFDNDLFELFYRLQARLRANRSGQLLCVRGR